MPKNKTKQNKTKNKNKKANQDSWNSSRRYFNRDLSTGLTERETVRERRMLSPVYKYWFSRTKSLTFLKPTLLQLIGIINQG